MGRVAPWCAAAVLLGLLGFALYRGLSHGWGHQESYQLPLPWAHRNVAFESLAFMTLLAARKRLKVRLVLWGLLVGAALVYQVRGVLLVGAAWGATMAWEHANNARWLLRAGAVAMGLFVLAQVAWNGLAVEDRVDLRAQLPDVVKTLDVVYNLKSATSSSERVQIWSWTLSNMHAVGGGSGSWKWAAEGFLQEQIGKCDVSIRRAHSDILQWLHELGWLPFALLTALAASRIWQARRFFLLAAPLLLFTFPSERAEIAVPMAMVFWLLQRPKSEAHAGASSPGLVDDGVGGMPSFWGRMGGVPACLGQGGSGPGRLERPDGVRAPLHRCLSIRRGHESHRRAFGASTECAGGEGACDCDGLRGVGSQAPFARRVEGMVGDAGGRPGEPLGLFGILENSG